MIKKIKGVILFLSGVLLAGTSCQEIYDPDISANEQMMVVDGLVTDEQGPYIVRLSYAILYDKAGYSVLPVEGAAAVIQEDENIKYPLWENPLRPGEYCSDSAGFTARPGHTYSLQVIAGGREYRSPPQMLVPAHEIDTIFGEVMTRKYPFTNAGGDLYYHCYKGGLIQVGYKNVVGSRGFRFNYSFYLQYVAEPLGMDNPPTYYIWHTETFLPEVNITGTDFNLATEHILHELCFLPFDEDYYAFIDDWPDTVYAGSLDSYVVLIDQYRLNDISWEYYKEMDKQLKAEGKMFDPVAAQLNGNILCVTEPRRKVLGFFEVSSHSSFAYEVRNVGDRVPLVFHKIPGFKAVPYTGFTINEPPPFWIK